MIAQNLITSAGTTLLTVPTGSNYAVVNIAICNYTDDDVTIDVHIVGSGNTLGPATTVIKSRELGAFDSLFLSTEKFLLSGGDALTLVASDDDVISATASYIAI